MMLSVTSQELMDHIKQSELRKVSFEMKFFHLQSVIKTTKAIADESPGKKLMSEDSLEIKRNIKLDLMIWLLIGLVAIFPISFVTLRQIKNVYSNPLGIIMGILLIFLFLFLAFRNLTSRKLKFPITLNDSHVNIGGKAYNWNEIENTFYVYRARKSFFVIGFKNGDLKYFDIGHQLGFKYSDHDFSAFVEYFKTKRFD
jgi:hypothetical protein